MTQATDQTTTGLPQDYNEASKHSFCVLPWLHRFVNLGGEVQLCCTAEEFDHSYIRQDSKQPINITDGLSDEQIGATRHMRDIRVRRPARMRSNLLAGANIHAVCSAF